MMFHCGNALGRRLVSTCGRRTQTAFTKRHDNLQKLQSNPNKNSRLFSENGSAKDKTIITPELSSPSVKAGKKVDVEKIASEHGVRLTKSEVQSLVRKLDMNKDGTVSMAELQKAGKLALGQKWTRELFLQVIEQPTSRSLQAASKLLAVFDYGGTALFAIVGTQLAGECDMNLIGCTLVGCIASMGGGSLNAMLYGSASSLLETPGVFWVKIPSYLMLTIGISIVTFYTWPLYCREVAKQKVKDAVGERNMYKDGSITRGTFLKACVNDKDFLECFRSAFKKPRASPEELFAEADVNKTGRLSSREMQAVVAKSYKFGTSTTMYVIDTFAMAAFAVVGVNGAIQRGLHPLVAATSGVTICFGGILRDVLCERDLAIGGQSYAFAMGAGSAVYVLLRELRLRGWPFPLIARIMIAFATTTGVRALEYARGEPLLRPMHYHENETDGLFALLEKKDPAEDYLTGVKESDDAKIARKYTMFFNGL